MGNGLLKHLTTEQDAPEGRSMKSRADVSRQGRIGSLFGLRIIGLAPAAILLAAASLALSPLPVSADSPLPLSADSPLPMSADSPAVSVLVSIVPQAFFVDRIGGKRVSTHVFIPAGRSPHAFEPTPTQMIEAAAANIYLTIGLPFEQNIVPRISDMSPDMTVVSTQAEENGLGHGSDPHTWMNPGLALAQSDAICNALATIDPHGADMYRANMDSLRVELLKLDEELSEILAPCRGGSFFVFHPAFGHFADAYGLEQIAIESEGKEPAARKLAELIESAASREIRAIFVQPQHTTKSAETLADEIGADLVPLDPLAYDYPSNLRKIAIAVAAATTVVIEEPAR